MALAPGTKLDSYEVISLLGTGGMGEVYRARDSVLKRDVAIKVLPSFISPEPDRLHRFEQEAQATAALNHPNILAIYRFGTVEGTPYIVSELLEGTTLGHLLARGPLPTRRAIDYAIQIARGLAAAHDRGIVHRDLKPENVFVTKDGRIKILDFGLAKFTEVAAAAGVDGPTISGGRRTDPGRVMGTVGYMSPEQVRGKPADHRSDIFACGTMLYEMLTGTRAFRKDTSAETLTAILREDPPNISQLVTGISPVLLRVVHRCLEKNAEQRFQSASDLAFALETMSDSGSSVAIAVEKAPRLRWPSIVFALGAIAIAGFVAWWTIPAPVPVVESITQLTDDGEEKLELGAVMATDGSRVYFGEGPTGSQHIGEVSVTGGSTAVVETRESDVWLQGITPDNSALLVFVNPAGNIEYPPWSIPIPAGESRRLGETLASAATYFPDGRLLLLQGKEIFVAEKDGSNPRHLATLNWISFYPSISPDGKWIVVTAFHDDKSELTMLPADGSSPPRRLGEGMARGTWSANGKYIIYGTSNSGGSDLWALPMQTGWFHRTTKPIRLTNSGLQFVGSQPSHDGKQLFTIGNKPRSELVSFDQKTHQFVPFFGGASAISPTFSADGQWMEYTSYPDHTLWRARADGSDRMQLTFPPLEVAYPHISYDGSKVSFSTAYGAVYIVSMQGGTPEKIIDSHTGTGLWSPDGKLLLLTSWTDVANGGTSYFTQLFDMSTRKTVAVPGGEKMVGAAWITQDTFVAANADNTEFRIFDLRTQKWTNLMSGHFVNWAVARDGKSMVFTTSGTDPLLQRVWFVNRRVETLSSLKALRRVVDPIEGQTQIDIAPDGSAIFARDIGTQEIYAIKLRWP